MSRNRQKCTERGAAIVELAIVLPLLLSLLMGMVEFGLLFYNKQVITNASREGARAGIVQLPPMPEAAIEAIVKDYCSARLVSFNTVPDVTLDIVGELGAYPQDLTVTVHYVYTFLVPELLGFGQTMQLTAKTVMKMEKVPSP
jgi:Flp pilus assembly protein TadG